MGPPHALHALQGHVVTARCLAEQACNIEIDRLAEPIGKQDQYIAAYGGLYSLLQFHPDKQVFGILVVCGTETRRE